jgi:2-polyprenyl-3-methyl-5-hydroxy-6-metoxy-1,4-benzoquinol methylase
MVGLMKHLEHMMSDSVLEELGGDNAARGFRSGGNPIPDRLHLDDPERSVATLESVRLHLDHMLGSEGSDDNLKRWLFQDIDMLKRLAAPSRQTVTTIMATAATQPKLAAALTGEVLEIGCALGAFSLELAAQAPASQISAIDFWNPALQVMRGEVEKSSFSKRIGISLNDMSQINDHERYSLVVLPSSFLPPQGAAAVLDRLTLAIKSGGSLIFGYTDKAESQLATIVAGLSLYRSSGHVWTGDDLEKQLRSRGFTNIMITTCDHGGKLMIGQRR